MGARVIQVVVCLILAFGQGTFARAQDDQENEENPLIDVENEGARVDYGRSYADFSHVRKDYDLLKRRASALARRASLLTLSPEDKRAIQRALVQTTVYLKEILDGGDILSGVEYPLRTRKDDRPSGTEEILADFEKWLPEFLERPEVADAIVESYWQNGRAPFAEKPNETSEEKEKRGTLIRRRLYALELLLSRVNGPDQKRVAHLILNPKMGLDDWRYAATLVAARKNPRLFSRALQGEFIQRVDLIQRVAPHQFGLTNIDSEKHPGNRLVTTLLDGIEKVPAPWVTKALTDLAIYDDRYPEVLRAYAALKLGQRAENFPGPDADRTSQLLQQWLRLSELSVLHRQKILEGLPPLSEADFRKLLVDIASDPGSASFLGDIIQALPKKAPKKLSDGGRTDLTERYRSFLRHPDKPLRIRAGYGLVTLLGSDAFPYQLEAAAEELRANPKNNVVAENLIRAITESLPRFHERDEMLAAFNSTLDLLDEHFDPHASRFDFTRLTTLLTSHHQILSSGYHPPAKLQRALIARLSSLLAKADQARAAFEHDEGHAALRESILVPLWTAVEATAKDSSVPVTLEGNVAHTVIGFALHHTQDVEWPVSTMAKLVRGVEQKTLPRDKEKLTHWLLTQNGTGRRSGIELAGRLQLPGTIDALSEIARSAGAERGIALDALGKIADRYKEGNAALEALKKDAGIAALLAPSPDWKKELEKLKAAVREDRRFQFAQPDMLEGTFHVAGGTKLNDSEEPFTIEIKRNPSRNGYATIAFTPRVFLYFDRDLELSRGKWHSTIPPSFTIGVAEGASEPTFTFENGARRMMERVLPKNDDYDKEDPCGKIAPLLPATPVVTRALLLKSCVALHWSDTPYTMKMQAFVDLEAHAKNLGTGAAVRPALTRLWEIFLVPESSSAMYSRSLDHRNALAAEDAKPPVEIHDRPGTHAGGKK